MPKTGPTSPDGKRKSSISALKHGARSPGFLRCKREKCFFFDLCDIVSEYGPEALREIPYGSPCPLELQKYEYLAYGYTAAITSDDPMVIDQLYDLIMLRLLQDRVAMLSAIEGNLIRLLPNSKQGFALGIRYRRDTNPKVFKLLAKVFPGGRSGEQN